MFDPMSVTTKRVLGKLGGDKITNKYTFDGNIEGKEYIQLSETMFIVKVSDVPMSVSKLKSVSVTFGEHKATLTAEDLTIDGDEKNEIINISNNEIPMASIAFKDVDIGIVLTKGIYLMVDKSIGFLVYAIEFAETIHPIDPKFLPGVCLPVVELTTEIPTDGTNISLSSAENIMLNKAAEMGLPCVVIMNFVETTLANILLMQVDGSNLSYSMIIGSTTALLLSCNTESGMWVASISEIG